MISRFPILSKYVIAISILIIGGGIACWMGYIEFVDARGISQTYVLDDGNLSIPFDRLVKTTLRWVFVKNAWVPFSHIALFGFAVWGEFRIRRRPRI